jgi:hypothetical protein
MASRRNPAPVPGGPQFLQRIFTRLGCAGRPPRFVVEFYPYASLVQTIRLRGDTAFVRLSDLMRQAPAPVLEAAAAILLGRLYRRGVPRPLAEPYQTYAVHHRTRRRVVRLRQSRAARPALNPMGRFFSLKPIFDSLNQEYFAGSLQPPCLGWSPRPWRAQLGCFDPALQQIVLSSRLDDARVPAYAVEYVMFHEMLHMRHPIRRAACGLQSHSRKFRAEEKRYLHYQRARRYLRRWR